MKPSSQFTNVNSVEDCARRHLQSIPVWSGGDTAAHLSESDRGQF